MYMLIVRCASQPFVCACTFLYYPSYFANITFSAPFRKAFQFLGAPVLTLGELVWQLLSTTSTSNQQNSTNKQSTQLTTIIEEHQKIDSFCQKLISDWLSQQNMKTTSKKLLQSTSTSHKHNNKSKPPAQLDVDLPQLIHVDKSSNAKNHHFAIPEINHLLLYPTSIAPKYVMEDLKRCMKTSECSSCPQKGKVSRDLISTLY